MTKLTDVINSKLPALAARRADTHKGDYGRALLVGGSIGMGGAISLAGLATLRSGDGLVTLAVPRCVQDVVASFEPSYMTHGLVDDGGQIAFMAADDIVRMASNVAAIALGPGLGRSSSTMDLVARLYQSLDRPMVVDADGLFALAESKESLANPNGPRILTPHPGEFERLAGERPEGARRVDAAAGLAQQDPSGRTIVVLKGHETVVTDGKRYSINQTGNPGMATGGSGDVLTGVITGLLCQGLEPFDAARLGAHLHGVAGDLAANELGQVSLIASDLLDYLPKSFLVALK